MFSKKHKLFFINLLFQNKCFNMFETLLQIDHTKSSEIPHKFLMFVEFNEISLFQF